jgi:hypothetical protein
MWAGWFRNVCIVEIRCLADNVEKRFLPTFDSMTEEAEKIEQEAWKRFEESADSDADPGAGAERAFQDGLAHYMDLEGLQQGFLNFSAAYCYHLFEQQILYFHKKELLKPQEEGNLELLNTKEVISRFKERGIVIYQFKSWPKIDELRLVANVVKHGDGLSCEQLKKLRPEMFIGPI